MSLADFFTFDAETAAQQVSTAMMSCPTWAITAFSCDWWASGTSGANIAILRERYEIHADTGPDMLQHDRQEGGVVIRGHVELPWAQNHACWARVMLTILTASSRTRFRTSASEICEVVSASSPPTF